MDSLSLLQGIFPTQGSNPGLPHCRRILYQLRHQGSPRKRSGRTKLSLPSSTLLVLTPRGLSKKGPFPRKASSPQPWQELLHKWPRMGEVFRTDMRQQVAETVRKGQARGSLTSFSRSTRKPFARKSEDAGSLPVPPGGQKAISSPLPLPLALVWSRPILKSPDPRVRCQPKTTYCGFRDCQHSEASHPAPTQRDQSSSSAFLLGSKVMFAILIC